MMEAFFQIASTILTWIVLIGTVALAIFGLLVLFRMLRRFTVDRLVYSRRFSEECVYEGDQLHLIETLWNPTPFPVLLIDVESYFYSGLGIGGQQAIKGDMCYFASRFHLMPFERITKHVDVIALHRGHYKLSSVSVFRCGEEKAMTAAAELYVYPKAEPLTEKLPAAYGLGDARSRSRLIRDPFETDGIRDYRTGDPFRTINFKMSAKLSSGGIPRLAVNRYEYCANNKSYIYQNFHLPKGKELHFDAYEALMEEGLRLSASLLVHSIKTGGLCAFAANCETPDGRQKVRFPLSGGEAHQKDILKEMAGMRAMDGVSFAGILAEDAMHGIRGAEIYLVTVYVDSAIGEQIYHLERMGNTVRVLLLKGGKS